MFAMFFPKKVAEQDLKIIIFLFVDNDGYTTHNLDPQFFYEKWAFQNKAGLLFVKTSFLKYRTRAIKTRSLIETALEY